MELRRLTEADYEQMLELYTQLDTLHAQARPDCIALREEIYPRDAFVQNLGNPICLSVGVFHGERMVAFAEATLWNESVMVKDLKTVCLDNIYVLPDYRRRGIAGKLFAEVEKWSREQGAVRLDLHTWSFNTGAIALYRAMGMTPQRYVFEKKL